MLKTSIPQTKIRITGSIIVLQVLESVLILAKLYGFIDNLLFVTSSSMKFMLSFIIFSPELCFAIITVQYLLHAQFKILHNLVVTTKGFQVLLSVLLIALGLGLHLYVYQRSLFHLLGIIMIYIIFNSVILILIKIKDKITE
ncbi:hypothetical protein CR532_01840 [Candidatus Borreliella tachyglossi]|uniref:Uncharacterized protein n=1 Tax=Candidatus Borreliella tachyglossi TaxID=1964448 RepID=A0A2S1LWR9_9SPIR|nr:hypothetical protein CR532_01840 [Candidatus Borreliella tachyglossi]